MGTSSPFEGVGNDRPLVPTFVDDAPAPPPPSPDDEEDGETPPAVPPAPPPRREPPPPEDPERFRSARSNFTRFAGSGGTDRRALGRAVSQWVSQSAGGSGSAAHRMGSSRGSAARIAGFLGSVGAQGIAAALATFNLEAMAGRPAQEILTALMEHFCPEGGSIDEGIARDAFVETIIDLADAGVTDLADLTPEQMQTVLELYIAHTIEDRIYNDIGTKAVQIPDDLRGAERVRDQLHDFILGGVSDALVEAAIDFRAIDPVTIERAIEGVYQASFDLLEAMGEEEADR